MEQFKNESNVDFLLIDLSYFIFHNYYAKKRYFQIQKKDVDDLINNKEFLEVFSNFDNKINEIKKKLKLNSKIIVIFAKDCQRCNIWRNDIYPEYKKSRKVDNEVGPFFKYTYSNIINKYNYIECNNCEADDVIGIITKNMIKYDKICKVVIITGDHDYLQLFDDQGRIEIFDLKCKSLKDKSLGNSKKDLLNKILIGDKSDNITAIHTKLGPKTALKYIDNENELKKKLEDLSIKEKFELNSKLIDMDQIPEIYKKNIKNEFMKLWKKICSTDLSV